MLDAGVTMRAFSSPEGLELELLQALQDSAQRPGMPWTGQMARHLPGRNW